MSQFDYARANLERYNKILTYFPDFDTLPERHPVKIRLWNSGLREIEDMGLPKRYISATEGPELINIDIHESIYLYGLLGTGKTHQMWARAKRVIWESTHLSYSRNDPPRALFIEANGLVLELRNTFNSPEIRELDVVKKYSEVPFLFIDDLGVEKCSDYVFTAFYTIINYRYAHELTTIISSNLTPMDLSEKFSDRISSRIKGMCEVVILNGRDRRL